MTASNWATRCNACGTSFRVSEEQLQVSDGYVRCGRCDAVFNAREALFELEQGLSTPMPLGPPEPRAAEPARVRQPEPVPPPEPVAEAPPPAIADEPAWDESLTATDERPEPSWIETAAETPPPAAEPEDANARLRDLLGVEGEIHPGLGEAASAPISAEPAAWNSLSAGSRPPPARRAHKALLGLACALLALALPLQWAWIERDALRARWPQLDQLVQSHWPSLGAEGWRHLEGLSVAASSLQATPQGKAYRLELVLQNRAGHVLAAPWLDLSLSDAQGQLLLRRALSPHELGAAAALKPGEQRRLQAVFRVDGERRVSGYELGLFHP